MEIEQEARNQDAELSVLGSSVVELPKAPGLETSS